MKRWVAIGGIVALTLTVIVVALLRNCGSAARSKTPHSTHTKQTRAPIQPSLMSDRDPEPAGSLRLVGRVVGPDGKAVASADVWIDSIPQRMVSTGADGAFEFESLLSRSYELRAKAGGLIGGPQMVRPVVGAAPVLIKLREGAHVVVTVVDAKNVAISGAEVRVIGEELVVATDAQGVAQISLHPGWVAFETIAAKYAPRRVSIPVGTFGSTEPITIVMHKGFPVSGRVLDEERKPIANARVYARQVSAMQSLDDEDKETTVTDQNGMFTIAAAVGMHSFVVIDDEHAPASSPTFDIDHAITDLEIIMKRGAVYSGTVVDAGGKPVANARVHCESMGPLGSRRYSATTDAKGTFEFGGLPRTIVMAYATSDQGVSDEAMVELMKQPERRDQKLVLKPSETASGVIAGVVVDETGAPLSDVLVNVALRRRMHTAMNSGGVDTSTATSTRTDVRGQFSFADLRGGDYGVWPGAFAPQPLPVEALQFAPGKLDRSWFMTIAKTGEKSLRLVMPRAGAIKGKLVYADTSEPVKEFAVRLEPSHDSDFGAAGQQGTFELRDVRPGTFVLGIGGPSLVETSKADVRVEPGKTTDVGTITVQRDGRTIRGKVVDSAGRPVAAARVMLGHGAVYGGLGKFDVNYTEALSAVTDATGAFSIAGAPNRPLGNSALVAGADHPDHGRSLPVAVPPSAGDPPPLTLVLRDCGGIRGTVTQNGKPLVATIIGAGWPEYGMAETNDDGAFVMSRLPAGPVVLHIHVSTEISRTHQRTVQVEAGTLTDVAIEIPIGTIKLAVTVKPKPGHEVAGAKLFLLLGTATFENYAQLSTRFFADHQGFASWEGDPNRPATFDRIVPGEYTVCTMPLAWSPNDQKLMKRVHGGNRENVKVYCTPVRVSPAPAMQTISVEVPAMAPLP